ncbi:MAG: sigma-70 family RNA polymerase sigma factor [Proteobacteria bacterium]|nr:sigma-70 family RNA polymerase sigma factor [Pseudomonadota bacterium]
MAIDTETYYRKYGPMVLRRCRHMLKDEEKARDAMHDVFVRLLMHEDRLHGTAPSSLLFRIATNVCLNKIRADSRRPETRDDDLLQRIAHVGDPEAQSTARAVLDRLFRGQKESTKTIAVLHLHDGMTLEEVAGEVGLSVSGVRKRLRSLRSQLHELEAV